MIREESSPIHFFFQKVPPNLKNIKKLKAFIALLFKKEGKQIGNLNYIFCTDKALHKINKSYLDHDFYTDIITFNLSSSRSIINGEIYISTERVKENAATFGTSFQKELHRVIFHGALHLCGYKDKTDGEKAKMKAKENYYLRKYE